MDKEKVIGTEEERKKVNKSEHRDGQAGKEKER